MKDRFRSVCGSARDLSNAREACPVYGDEQRVITAPNEITAALTQTAVYRLVACGDVGQTETALGITVDSE